MDLQDLPPRKDPKGGSPRTPIGGIKQADYAEYIEPHNGNGVWKLLACTAITACFGLIGMYCTALRSQGVSQKDMQEYVDKYSAYSHDKEVIAIQQAAQDKEIGSLTGHKDRIFDRLRMIEDKHIEYDGKFSDLYKKLDTVTNYLEEEKKVKR